MDEELDVLELADAPTTNGGSGLSESLGGAPSTKLPPMEQAPSVPRPDGSDAGFEASPEIIKDPVYDTRPTTVTSGGTPIVAIPVIPIVTEGGTILGGGGFGGGGMASEEEQAPRKKNWFPVILIGTGILILFVKPKKEK